MNTATAAAMRSPRSAGMRVIGFAILWLMLAGDSPADLGAGAVAAVAATWVSLHLLPPSRSRMRPVAFARFAVRFLQQSVIAGVDVARRAFDPRLPLSPGFAVYPVGLPPGSGRNMFTALMSLSPGTVPTGPDPRDRLLVHCLDVEQPITAQLAAEEAAFAQAIGRRPEDG